MRSEVNHNEQLKRPQRPQSVSQTLVGERKGCKTITYAHSAKPVVAVAKV
jgi:hypothetical protein